MNRSLLTVKNAIERVVQGQIAVCLSAVAAKTYTCQHFTEMAEFVEKFVASLYVSGQIDRNFSIESSLSSLRVTVKFSVGGHHSIVDNMLPAALYYTAATLDTEEQPLPEISFVEFDDYQEAVYQFNAEKNLLKEQALASELLGQKVGVALDTFIPIAEVTADVIDAYDRAKKFTAR